MADAPERPDAPTVRLGDLYQQLQQHGRQHDADGPDSLTEPVLRKGPDIPSAATLRPLGGNYIHVTGTTTITSIGIAELGKVYVFVFDGILTLTHNATSLILAGAADITTAAGTVVAFIHEGNGNWREWNSLSGVNFQAFTTAGTFSWTKPAGAVVVEVILVGGGGGGGGGRGGSAGNWRIGGGGGGGGAWSTKMFRASALAATEEVIVGAGGTGGAGGSSANGTIGASGGNSTFGATQVSPYIPHKAASGGGGGGDGGGGGGTALNTGLGGSVFTPFVNRHVGRGGGGGGSNLQQGLSGSEDEVGSPGAGGGPLFLDSPVESLGHRGDGLGAIGGEGGPPLGFQGKSAEYGGGGGGSGGSGNGGLNFNNTGGNGGASYHGGGGGAGGAGVSDTNTDRGGGAGGSGLSSAGTTNGGTAGAASGGAAGAGGARTSGHGGDGGGGGGGNSGGTGGAGGAGGAPGGGGGGGGGGTSVGGAGAAGGAGLVFVISYP